MIELDGSLGEGGGQVVRTALSLSCLTHIPFRIVNIRKNRSKPGLQPQHLMAVKALKSVCQAEVEGDGIASETLNFKPRTAASGDYVFDIGTAGSTSLLLQALLPPLIFADGPTTIRLIGGTHVPMSPPFDYVQSIFGAFLSYIGLDVGISIEQYGFYPRGGGQIVSSVVPITEGRTIPAVEFRSTKESQKVEGISAVGNLPLDIAERQRDAAVQVLRANGLEARIDIKSVPTPGRGTYIFLRLQNGECATGFSSIGKRGKRAEIVGREATDELLLYLRLGSCLDPHLADQVLIYLALAEGQSTFRTSMITEHLITNLSIIRKFLPIDFQIQGQKGQPGAVVINGIGYRR